MISSVYINEDKFEPTSEALGDKDLSRCQTEKMSLKASTDSFGRRFDLVERDSLQMLFDFL